MAARAKEEKKVALHAKIEGLIEISPFEQGQSDILLRDINKVDGLD
jgi:hypothetical protein